MTLPQELRWWKRLEVAPVLKEPLVLLHTFEDGWTCCRIEDEGEVNRVGNFMVNCWKSPEVKYEMILRREEVRPQRYHALYDQHGLPRVAFFIEGDHYIGSLLRARNEMAMTEDYVRLLEIWPHHPSLKGYAYTHQGRQLRMDMPVPIPHEAHIRIAFDRDLGPPTPLHWQRLLEV